LGGVSIGLGGIAKPLRGISKYLESISHRIGISSMVFIASTTSLATIFKSFQGNPLRLRAVIVTYKCILSTCSTTFTIQ